MAKVLNRPTSVELPPASLPSLETRYRMVCDVVPDYRVELVNARIVVNEVPTGAHNDIIALLLFQITGFLIKKNWRPWTNIKVFLGAQADRYIPDLAIVPKNPRMWGDDEVYAECVKLVVEVVSPSSVHDDYDIKPSAYAAAGVPVFLRVDPMKQTISLFADPRDNRYRTEHHVEAGKRLDLPEPWNLALDTGALIESPPEEQAE
ncbi:Uma2 family endonuclease [Nonomuraea sp. NBC_01738]|uniref:Uma2 family endonuclease n=1 Tax=Nonomuraea sp. NBC_01738 TaxID=2976003 RepID=UPI002E1201A3|nr:Uma2 family endonuclease [Nonomuraea sp. NBC_01738]